MRKLSTAANTALLLEPTTFVLLGKIQLSSSVVRVTSSPYDVTFLGEVYSASNSVVGFGPPRASSSVDREIYELIFLDHANVIQQELRVGITGLPMTIYVAFKNSSNQLLLAEEDVLIAYKGFIDSGKVVNNGETKQAILAAASPMASLDATGGYIVSKDGMDQVNLADTSFDDIYVGGQAVNLKWGKD